MTTRGKQFLGYTLLVVASLSAITLGWRYYDYNKDHDKWEIIRQAQADTEAALGPKFRADLQPEPKPPSAPAYVLGIAACAIGAFVALNSAASDKRKVAGAAQSQGPREA